MGISYDSVNGRGIVFYGESDNYKDEILSFIKYINPNFFINNQYDDDSLEIVLHENSLLDIHLGMENIGNCVTGKGAGIFIKILSDLGEDVLNEFGKTIEDVNEVCIM